MKDCDATIKTKEWAVVHHMVHCHCVNIAYTLLLLVPFSYKLMHHLKPFAIVVLNGEITVYSVDFSKWFWMVGQLIQNLVWIFPNGSTANTKPCFDTSKWWINGPSKTIWMDLNGSTACYQHCSMVSPCVYKTNGHFWKWKFWMVSNGLPVGGLMFLNCFKWSTSRRVKIVMSPYVLPL